jgi:hypothetical protein
MRKWEDSIEINLQEIRYEDMYRIHLALDKVRWLAVVNTIMNVCVSSKVRDFLSSCWLHKKGPASWSYM